MVRGPFYDKNGVKKGAWSAEEDEKLRAYVKRYGHWNWREIPKFAGLSRCGKSCRLRWMNYLRPEVKHGNYTQEEEDIIIKFHQQLGNKWSMIAAKLPGRTDNEIKNYWHTHLKKRMSQTPTTSSEPTTKQHQSCETSDKLKSQHSRQVESETMLVHHPILESSSFSTETSSSEISSAVTTMDQNEASGSCLNSRDGAAKLFEIHEDSSGNDFWTQPFVSDNSYVHNEIYPLASGELGFVSSDFVDVDLFDQFV